ncbi:MAG: hypothetical protein KGY81_09490 [Phycisphaerae bacterium]|jgi:hypothetical protein|nr:hypothetical protein [Phycisphaerae bacterium]
MATAHEMTAERTDGGLVLLMQAMSVEQADLIEATLRVEGIGVLVEGANVRSWYPHYQYALSRGQIRIFVAAEDVGRAQEVLREHPLTGLDAKGDTSSETPEDFARHGLQTSVLAFIIPFVIPWAVCDTVKAWKLSETLPLRRRRRCRRLLRVSWLLLGGWLVVVAFITMSLLGVVD